MDNNTHPVIKTAKLGNCFDNEFTAALLPFILNYRKYLEEEPPHWQPPLLIGNGQIHQIWAFPGCIGPVGEVTPHYLRSPNT